MKLLRKFYQFKHYSLLILTLFLVRVIFAFWVNHPDVNNHIDWGIRFFEYGPSKFYDPSSNVWSYTWPNQPPGTIYIFAAIRIIFENIFSALLYINDTIKVFPSNIVTYSENRLYPALLQFPAILADFVIAFLIYYFLKDYNKKLSKLSAVLFLINPVIWYNSSVWGQYDSIICALALAAFIFAFKDKLFLSLLSFALSLYIKVSLIVLLPLYLIYLLKNYKIMNIIKFSLATILVVIFINLPFSSSENPVSWLYNLYTQKVLAEQLHLITANAFNFWGFAAGVVWRPNSLPLFGANYAFWGYLLFFVFSTPIYFSALKTNSKVKTLFIVGMAYFTAWMFLTNMHERYLYPFFVFALPAVVLNARVLIAYFIAAFLNVFNMYFLWYVPKFYYLMYIANAVNKRFISFLMLIVYFVLYKYIFRNKVPNQL